jgi:hypothetical protein
VLLASRTLPPLAYSDRITRINPGYIALHRYADLDAFFEFYGHLRAAT